MDEKEIEHLESSVEELIQINMRLHAENVQLRAQITGITSERDNMDNKNQQARLQMEQIIKKLKTMEFDL